MLPCPLICKVISLNDIPILQIVKYILQSVRFAFRVSLVDFLRFRCRLVHHIWFLNIRCKYPQVNGAYAIS